MSFLHLRKVFRAAPASGTCILLYHRVAEEAVDPCALCVAPKHLAEHLQAIRDLNLPVRPLSQVLSRKRGARAAVALTFDDGYLDSLICAKPILERFGAPATFFVTTGAYGRTREFWWDELERMVLLSRTLASSLTLNVNGAAHTWKLGDGRFGNHLPPDHSVNWRVWEPARNERQRLYGSLHALLAGLPFCDQEDCLDQLRRWAGADEAPRNNRLCISLGQIADLAAGNLFEIGAHTVNHPRLAALHPAHQRDEILENRACLEEIVGHRVEAFAYPYGGPTDFTSHTEAIVRDSGFARACVGTNGIASSSSPTFRLPRYRVENCNGDRFSEYLRSFS